MIESIINLVKKEALGAITNNTDIPEAKKKEAVEATTSGFVEGLKKQLKEGALSSLMGSKSNNSMDLTSQVFITPIISFVESKLVNSVGLNPTTAKGVSSLVVPTVMKILSSKSNDNNDSFNIQSLLSSLTSDNDKQGGLLGTIGGLFTKS